MSFRAILMTLTVLYSPAVAADPAPAIEAGFLGRPLLFDVRPGATTWNEVLQLVGEGSPVIRLVEAEISVAAADTIGTAQYPNPELGIELEEGGIGGPLYKPSVAKVTVAQTILTGGKRGRAGIAAQRGVRVAETALDAQRSKATAAIARAYVGILHRKYMRCLAERSLELTLWDRELTRMRVKGGDLGDGALHRMDAAVHMAGAAVERTDGALTEALTALPLEWSGDPGEISDLAGALPLPRPPPDLPGLLDAADTAPSAILTERWIDHAEAGSAVARAARAPDVTIEAGYIIADGLSEHGWLLGFSIPIPAFDRNQGDIARASARLLRARRNKRLVLAQLRSDVVRAHALLTSLHREWTQLENSVIPASRRSWRAVQDAFAGGELTLLDIAASSADLLALQKREIAIRTEHALARIALDEALGRIPRFLDSEVTP